MNARPAGQTSAKTCVSDFRSLRALTFVTFVRGAQQRDEIAAAQNVVD